jgi:hypothetical protein
MIHRFVNSGIELFIGNGLGLGGVGRGLPFRRSALARRTSPDGAGWGSRARMLTSSSSSSSRKLRPSNFSIAVLAEAGRSRAQLIETFSITPLVPVLTIAPLPKPVLPLNLLCRSRSVPIEFCQRTSSFLPCSNGSRCFLAALQRTTAGQVWERQF